MLFRPNVRRSSIDGSANIPPTDIDVLLTTAAWADRRVSQGDCSYCIRRFVHQMASCRPKGYDYITMVCDTSNYLVSRSLLVVSTWASKSIYDVRDCPTGRAILGVRQTISESSPGLWSAIKWFLKDRSLCSTHNLLCARPSSSVPHLDRHRCECRGILFICKNVLQMASYGFPWHSKVRISEHTTATNQ